MANEWVKVELYGANNDGNPRRYTIADGNAVSIGQVLALIDPRACSAAIGISGDTYAGIAAEDHLPSVGSTSIAVWTDGIFEATASDAITLGSAIMANDVNQAQAAKNAASGAQVLGYCLESAAAGELVNVRLRM